MANEKELIGTPADKDYFKRYPDVYNFIVTDGSQPFLEGRISGYYHYLNWGIEQGKTYNLSLNQPKLNWKVILAIVAAIGLLIYFTRK